MRKPENHAAEQLKNFLEKNGHDVISGLSSFSKIPNSDRPTADVQAQIDYAIELILKDKASILKASTNYDKRVLLIESRYFFARQDNVTHSIRKAYDLRDGVDLIYLVTPKSVDIVG